MEIQLHQIFSSNFYKIISLNMKQLSFILEVHFHPLTKIFLNQKWTFSLRK